MAIELNIQNLYGGGAVERLHGALHDALQNILDPNTPAKYFKPIIDTRDMSCFAIKVRPWLATEYVLDFRDNHQGHFPGQKDVRFVDYVKARLTRQAVTAVEGEENE